MCEQILEKHSQRTSKRLLNQLVPAKVTTKNQKQFSKKMKTRP